MAVTERISASISDEVYDQLQSRLEYGDNRSAIVEQALAEYLEGFEA